VNRPSSIEGAERQTWPPIARHLLTKPPTPTSETVFGVLQAK
jgi:hypothetical protein